MCGIGGIIGKRSPTIAKKIIEKLKHRGPDSDGFWLSDEGEFPITICHTRLSIIDLSTQGSQPFFSSDKRYVISFNGEIYNFIELKKELQKKGCVFKTKTDTEVLLLGLINEGPEFQLKCNGMWSFCLWDRKLQKGILSRDRFGIKPLYYANQSESLIFASEMKSITPFLDSINPSKNIDHFLRSIFNYEATEECCIDGIKKLKSGHYLVFEDGLIKTKRYWNTLDHISKRKDKYEDQVEEWKYLFLDSVKLRMRSDVSIGSALSGGLDSSSIVSAMSFISKNNKEEYFCNDWQHAFCSSFPGTSNDETVWAKRVADDLSIPFKEIVFNPSKYPFSLIESIAMVEDPYLSMPFPMLNTYKEIKASGINVTLDGHGADELFSGYDHIKKAISSSFNLKHIRELIAIEESTKSGIFSLKEKKVKRKWVKYKLRNIFNNLLFSSYKSLSRVSKYKLNPFRISPSYFDNDLHEHPCYLEMDSFSQVIFEIFHYTILPTLLRNYDKYSMASGVEIRMPFMDWRLVCNSFSLPLQSKLGNTFTKRIQRDALDNILLDSVRLRRDKIGWNAPCQDWFKGNLKDEVEYIIENNKDSFHYKTSKKAWEKFHFLKEPTFDNGYQTWMKILPLIWKTSLSNKIWK